MVMEAPPSPQSVGREFVRQYYTLLNQAPAHLHRFYNQQSSFVHGGMDPLNRETSPVIGQKQIHQKIQQLNFHDCHAKITQVDSQATLGNGVVVQVTGELSNDGQPMRRFTQTFVLAAQSPKKYYVHNDIFRYQDIISDEECDNDVRSEPEEDLGAERQVLGDVQHINQPVVASYYPNAAPIPQMQHHHPPHVLNAQQVPTVNGAMHPEEINVLGGPQTHVAPTGQTPLAGPLPMQSIVPQPLNQVDEVQQVVDEPVDEIVEPTPYEAVEPEIEQDLPSESVSNEPKTYANLLKSGSINVPYQSPPHKSIQMDNISPPSNNNTYNPGQRNNLNSRGSSGPGAPPSGNNARMNQPRMPRQDTPGGRGPPLGDGHQLFLGNLPHTATEDELREIFREYGTIADLKVYTKFNKPGMPTNRAPPPNYGFITYESPQGVQKCLQSKPIYYPKGDIDGTSLNVEEKKTKDRPSYGGGRPMDNNRGRGGDNGAPRRSLGGLGGGVNRPNNVGSVGGPNNRNNSYQRTSGGGGGGGGGPPNRGPNNYQRR